MEIPTRERGGKGDVVGVRFLNPKRRSKKREGAAL